MLLLSETKLPMSSDTQYQVLWPSASFENPGPYLPIPTGCRNKVLVGGYLASVKTLESISAKVESRLPPAWL